jgi:hypothetical protein
LPVIVTPFLVLQAREKAIAKVRRTQPAAYLKILALLVPREMKVEHSGGVKDLNEELEQAIALGRIEIPQRRRLLPYSFRSGVECRASNPFHPREPHRQR